MRGSVPDADYALLRRLVVEWRCLRFDVSRTRR
jgi:hypothetical protein